jgi:hypothetical protein
LEKALDFEDKLQGMKFYGLLICGLLAGLQLLSCSSHKPRPSTLIYGFRSSSADFNLGDAARFEFNIGRIGGDGQRRLVIAYAKHDRANGEQLGEFLRISTDGGESFGPERRLPGVALSQFIFFAYSENDLAAVYASNPRYSNAVSNLFYTRLETDGATWSEPVQINDEQDSVLLGGGGSFTFVQPAANEIDCLWIDKRRGFGLVFFSASHDGGRTWTPNQVVEHDFREGVQLAPQLVVGAKDRLLAFWPDGRDRQTLFDIRCSYSDDGGLHWSASQKLNNDTERVWQIRPKAVARGNEIYVAFADFRDPGEEGSNDWNIYFAASSDNGETWKTNIRLNDVQAGVDSDPSLTIDEQGNLYCLWGSGRESILGELYFAYSTDGGRSWSRSIKVTEGEELLYRQASDDLITVAGGKLLFRWQEGRPGWEKLRLTWLEPLSAPAPINKPATTPATEHHASAPFARGEALFADDFSSGNQARWQAATGVWTISDGALMGVEPGASAPFSSFARWQEPHSYLLRGRFKLDPVHHQMAYVYFRANPAARTSYVINNGFQTGVCLSLKEDDSPPIAIGPFALDGRPLAQRRVPFQNNRWYEFMLMVKPDRVDYFVDGRWMLSYEGRLKLPPGSLGVGGFGSAPTYFDDIVVSELK